MLKSLSEAKCLKEEWGRVSILVVLGVFLCPSNRKTLADVMLNLAIGVFLIKKTKPKTKTQILEK